MAMVGAIRICDGATGAIRFAKLDCVGVLRPIVTDDEQIGRHWQELKSVAVLGSAGSDAAVPRS